MFCAVPKQSLWIKVPEHFSAHIYLGKPKPCCAATSKDLIPQIQMGSEYQCVHILSPCCMDADMQPKSSGAECPQTCSRSKKLHFLFCFISMSLEVIRSKLGIKEKKNEGETVTLMFPLQFFIEAGLRGQVLRKTSLCGEKCTGNKPKWH